MTALMSFHVQVKNSTACGRGLPERAVPFLAQSVAQNALWPNEINPDIGLSPSFYGNIWKSSESQTTTATVSLRQQTSSGRPHRSV
jgi:hypothetical protein